MVFNISIITFFKQFNVIRVGIKEFISIVWTLTLNRRLLDFNISIITVVEKCNVIRVGIREFISIIWTLT